MAMAVRIAATIGLNGDGDYEDTHFETTPHRVKKHTWVLDHLEPGADLSRHGGRH